MLASSMLLSVRLEIVKFWLLSSKFNLRVALDMVLSCHSIADIKNFNNFNNIFNFV